MRFRWPSARVPIPCIKSAGPEAKVDWKPRAYGTIRGRVDHQQVREAIRAKSIAQQAGSVWEAYAGCDRAPFGWETR